MKKNIKELGIGVLSLLLAYSPFLLTSCSDVVDARIDDYTTASRLPNTGAPVITAVYDSQDEVRTEDTQLTEAIVGNMVRITGQNLNFVKSITFNHVEADLSTLYTASTFANVNIPANFSTEKYNKIEYTTDQGTATFDFRVLPKPLVVEGLKNEFASADEELVIVGENLDCYGFDTGEGTLTYNGSVIPLTSVTSDAITFTRPASAGDNSEFVLSWSDGEGETQTSYLYYRPTSLLLYGDDFNVEGGSGQPLQWSKETDDDVTTGAGALGYANVHLTGTMSQWAWNWVKVCNNVDGLDQITNRANYNLVFEVLTAEGHPLPASKNESMDGFMFGLNQSGENGCEWTIESSFDTKGKWRTVRLPLKKVMVLPIYSNPSSHWVELQMTFQALVAGSYDMRLANFRIEKIPNPADWSDEVEVTEPETPDTPTGGETILSETQTVIGNWENNVCISASAFANAQVGDVVTVYVSDISDGAQIKLSNPTDSWDALDTSVDCAALATTDTKFEMPITAAILSLLQANGMAVQGKNFTVDKVTLTKAE